MQDGIIVGDGSSRSLKAQSVPESFADFRTALLAGTLLVDLGINPDGWTQIGTYMSKANLLKDATALLLGMDSGATLDDVLAKVLAEGIYSKITEIATSTTLALSHAGRTLLVNSASAVTITVPPHSSVAFEVGTEIDIGQMAAGQVTLAAGAGVTLRAEGGYLDTTAQYAGFIIKQTAEDVWWVAGKLE